MNQKSNCPGVLYTYTLEGKDHIPCKTPMRTYGYVLPQTNEKFLIPQYSKACSRWTLFTHAEAIALPMKVYKPWKYVPQLCPSFGFWFQKIR